MTSETNKLIKNVAFDIVALTTLWGLTNISLYQNDLFIKFNFLKYFYRFNYSNMYTKFLTVGYSVILIYKYY